MIPLIYLTIQNKTNFPDKMISCQMGVKLYTFIRLPLSYKNILSGFYNRKNTQLKMMQEESLSQVYPYSTQKKVCFNPFCSESTNRVIVSGEQSEGNFCHPKCSGWSLNIEYFKGDQQSLQKRPNIVNYENKPIKSLLRLSEGYFGQISDKPKKSELDQTIKDLQRQEPLQTLRISFEQIQASIEKQLMKSFKQIQKNIKSIQKMHTQTVNELKDISRSKDEAQIQGKINQSEVLKRYALFIRQKGYLVVLNDQKALKDVYQITQSIKQLESCFWTPELVSRKRQRSALRRAQMRAGVTSSMKHEGDKPTSVSSSMISKHPAQQIQQIGNMFKTGTIQPIYSLDKNVVQLKCWLCSEYFSGEGNNIKERKSSAYEKLLRHVEQQHRKQIKSKMTQETMNLLSYKVSFREMLQQLETTSYQKYIVIDKENIGKLQVQDYQRKDCYCINVVTKQTENLAKGRYIMTESTGKDSADTLIILVVRAITQSGFFRAHKDNGTVKQVCLYTRDHFGDNLKQILSEIGISITIVR